MRNLKCVVIFTLLIVTLVQVLRAQEAITLNANAPLKFSIEGRKSHEYLIDLKPGDICNITTDASSDSPILMAIMSPTGADFVRDVNPHEGYVFVADMPGTYKLTFDVIKEMSDEEISKSSGKRINVRYSNKFALPAAAKTASSRTVNGYQIKIANEPGNEGKTYLVIQKAGKLKALMRAEKEITGGFYFSDDPRQLDGANAKQSAALMRTTADKTGDGTPDVAVEYYTGGAHCCFEITFFELGESVRQLPTIDTDNDRMTAIGKKPRGGLRFRFAEQAFAYWNINFAQSPMPTVIYEFDKSDKLMPRFDLMKKPPPTPAKLKRDAAAMKAKINLNPYTSPEDNFNDWEEPFWSDMLDLIYSGHEDLAWQYFDLVWPEKKKGKEKFRSDFIEQLAHATYGGWKGVNREE